MSDLRTDEEQVEALKRWWEENGKQLSIAVVLSLAGWFGWNTYQDKQQVTGEQAQLKYQELLNLRQAGESSEESLAKAQLSATEIKKNYPGTPYAVFAALFLAKDAVEDDQLDQAVEELKWAKNAAKNSALKSLIDTRMARVLGSQGKLDEALALVSKAPENAYKRLFLEIRGDLLTQKGDLAAAKVAYDAALALDLNLSPSPYLEMKAADLTGVVAESSGSSEGSDPVSVEEKPANESADKRSAVGESNG